jgi:methyl-accepting chemotaxis protein
MNKIIKVSAVLALGMTISLGADMSSLKNAAKSYVEDGVAHCKKVGIAQCTKDFDKGSGKEWIKEEGGQTLYIWANDFDGIITAHPMKPLKGKNLYRYKDKKGNQLFANFIKKVKADGEGWVDYVWAHPKSKKQADKTSFVKGIGENQLIGCGIYLNEKAQ